MHIWFWLATLLAVSLSANATSFDCAKASTLVENAICGSARLSSLDDELMASYRTALSNSGDPETLKAAQRRWLTKVRDRCTNESCLASAYARRNGELAALSNGTKSLEERSAPMAVSFRGNIVLPASSRNSDGLGAIESRDGGTLAIFEMHSRLGRRIIAECTMGDYCEVTGSVAGKYNRFVSLSRVRLLRAGD